MTIRRVAATHDHDSLLVFMLASEASTDDEAIAELAAALEVTVDYLTGDERFSEVAVLELPEPEPYVIQDTEGPEEACEHCGDSRLVLLPKDGGGAAFRICWGCKTLVEVGRGVVQYGPTDAEGEGEGS